MTELWNIPDKGSFRNPYFAGRANKKEVDPKDDSDSVYEISTTDESDDSQPKSDVGVDGSKKRRPRRKNNQKQTTSLNSVLKTESAVKKAVKSEENKKDMQNDAKDIIPGLDQSTLNKTDQIKGEKVIMDEKDEKETKMSSDEILEPVKTDLRETDQKMADVKEVKEIQDMSQNVDTCTKPIDAVNGQLDDTREPKCIRIGCCNAPVAHTEWDNEFCSFKCVVEHCKVAFLNWTKARQAEVAEEVRVKSTQAGEAQIALKG